jgi:hypothetical protein
MIGEYLSEKKGPVLICHKREGTTIMRIEAAHAFGQSGPEINLPLK